MPDTPPMSAEDGAIEAVAEATARVVAEAMAEWSRGASAKPRTWDVATAEHVLKALSSEGLAVVAREDRLTPVEARALLALLESKLTIDSPPVQKGESTARPKLRRLSGADQDG